MSNAAFGNFLKELRTAKRISLREFCERNKLDAGNYSRLERGLFSAPHSEELIERYAVALGVTPGTDNWIKLFDLAAASRGEIPKDLLEDGELVLKLPALFRTLRANPVPPEKLDALIEKIRRT